MHCVQEAKGACNFLSFANNHIIKPFETLSRNKSFRKRNPFCSVFSDPFDERLKHAKDMVTCLINSWHPLVARNNKESEHLNDVSIKESEDRNKIICEVAEQEIDAAGVTTTEDTKDDIQSILHSIEIRG